jgi:DNA polymerase-1
VACDYDTLELRTLAQTCLTLFGKSQLAKAFWDGLDPHTWLASLIMGIPYTEAAERRKNEDEAVEYNRQLAKIANFGYPGGLGALSFVSYAAGYGVTLTPEEAQDLKSKWLQAWPEMQLYFIYVNQCIEEEGQISLPMSGRVKGDIKFTQAANYLFQGAAADGAKEACFRVAEACYNKPDSPLYGCHPVAFIHDEILAEVLIERAHEASEELSRIMCEAMKKFCPDIPITAGPALMDRWLKKAAEARDENGRLILWTPGA